MRWLLIAAALGLAYTLYDFRRYQERMNPRGLVRTKQTPAEIAEATDAYVRRIPVHGTT